ncbi:hypothetical protein fugu_004534 [Takifugu bimaculatus]|uniref:U6 snRNA-associated Sm-like protein LSm1 n=1 Tax=Takifugu bimaculatus TaxID=433685 RepID=A0A4Z2BGL9_9TELE|nr:hypothetical protein fugu_004534 [Takifugu bimaculatus]
MNYVPGTASLIDDIDKKHLVLLRDGRTLIGYLRSIDQFANLVFHQTVERIHVGKKFGDIPRGIFIVRGENVVLLGEIDLDKPCDSLPAAGLHRGDPGGAAAGAAGQTGDGEGEAAGPEGPRPVHAQSGQLRRILTCFQQLGFECRRLRTFEFWGTRGRLHSSVEFHDDDWEVLKDHDGKLG